ncbi:GLUCAN ENDO-13-BETA-GLUCOSIDASE BG1-RELATED-RELATED [Salix purpurea]|uniref:glucan endo-1,3-beta-D-glucosidase n=1 Tax=Salix purpurea TaxID=77065 RepID=A0A9Q0PC90_SALPP|nr:GLUCAN ENDO-13-BETA-GLUCOSIDASE BG1-RELATED-RELATED [Salix purpurea]
MDQSLPCKAIFLVATTLLVLLQIPFISAIGINYGLNGDNLPAPPAVTDLYGRCNIPSIQLFEPRPEVLRALRGKPLQVILGTRNEDMKNLAATLDAANSWVADNIAPTDLMLTSRILQ